MSEESTPQKELLCGLGAAIVGIATTYPVTKLSYRQIINNVGLLPALRKIREEGVAYVFRGVMPPMMQRAITLSIMFGVYRGTTQPLEKYRINPYAEKILGSCMSGSTESLFVPFERIQLLLVDPAHHLRFRNTWDAFLKVGREYGIREYYRGYSVMLLRNCLSNSCFFIAKSKAEDVFQGRSSKFVKGARDFFVGACLGAFTGYLLYPLKVIKVEIHQRLGGPHQSIFEVAKTVYRRPPGGIANFYKGSILNALRSVLAWGVTNTAYEHIKHYVL